MAFYNPYNLREITPAERYLQDCFDAILYDDEKQPGEKYPNCAYPSKETKDAIWEVVRIIYSRFCNHDKDSFEGIRKCNAPTAFCVYNHARAIIHEIAPPDYSNVRIG